MVQRRSLAWTELRVGIVVIVSFLLLALAIFFIGGQAGFFGPKYTIVAYFQNANNLRNGAEVHLEGVTIGNVNAVRISKLADPQKAVEAELRLDQTYQNIIRTDSRVTIRTIGLLGDSAVDITRGTEAGQVLEDGGAIEGSEEGDIRKIVQGTNDFVANLQVLSDDVKKMAERVERGEGTLGKLLSDTSIYDEFRDSVNKFSMLVSSIQNGEGTAGKFIKDPTLYNSLNQSSSEIQKLLYDFRQNPKKFLTISFKLF